MGTMDESLAAVGARIKAARLAHRPPLRLVDVAGERLTAGMLSKIERGRVSASLGTLQYLATRLGVPLASLFVLSGRGDAGGGVGGDPAAGGALGDALGAARAALWLGDPADAERRAGAVAGALGAGGPALLRAAALGVAAEAMLERGGAEGAGHQVAAASEILAGAPAPAGAAGGAGLGATEAQLAWVLGLLERRRGKLDGAVRAWTQAVERLDAGDDTAGGAGATLLRARLLLELGGLHAVAGTPQTAGSLIRRAVLALRWLRDAGAVARAALPPALEAPPAALPPAGAAESAAEALAAVAFARHLEERAEGELTRLDRPLLRRAAGTPADVPHSRHLR
jgi:transcriptional regulator with XRE-family HTH domain